MTIETIEKRRLDLILQALELMRREMTEAGQSTREFYSKDWLRQYYPKHQLTDEEISVVLNAPVKEVLKRFDLKF